MFGNSWFRKLKPLPSMIGLGGGATSLAQNAGGLDEWRLFLMGAGGGGRSTPASNHYQNSTSKGGSGAVVVASGAMLAPTDVFYCYVGSPGLYGAGPYDESQIMNPWIFGGGTPIGNGITGGYGGSGQNQGAGGGGGLAMIVANGPAPGAGPPIGTPSDPTGNTYIIAVAGAGGGTQGRGGGSGGGPVILMPTDPTHPGTSPEWARGGSGGNLDGGTGGGTLTAGGAGNAGRPGPASPGPAGYFLAGAAGGGNCPQPGAGGGAGFYGGGGGGGGYAGTGGVTPTNPWSSAGGGGSSFVNPSWTTEVSTVGHEGPPWAGAQPGAIGPVPTTYHPYYSTPTDPQMTYYGTGAPYSNPYWHGPGTSDFGGRARIVIENVTKGYKRTVNFSGAIEQIPVAYTSGGLDFSFDSFSTTGSQDKYRNNAGWGAWTPGTKNCLVASHASSAGFGMEFNFSGPNSTFTDFEVMSCAGGGGSFTGHFNTDSPFPVSTQAEGSGCIASGSLAPNLPGGNVTKFTLTTSGNSTNANIQVSAIKVNGAVIDFGQNWI